MNATHFLNVIIAVIYLNFTSAEKDCNEEQRRQMHKVFTGCTEKYYQEFEGKKGDESGTSNIFCDFVENLIDDCGDLWKMCHVSSEVTVMKEMQIESLYRYYAAFYIDNCDIVKKYNDKPFARKEKCSEQDQIISQNLFQKCSHEISSNVYTTIQDMSDEYGISKYLCVALDNIEESCSKHLSQCLSKKDSAHIINLHLEEIEHFFDNFMQDLIPTARSAGCGSFSFQMREDLESIDKIVNNIDNNVISMTKTDDTEYLENNVNEVTKHLPLFEEHQVPVADKENTKGNEENNVNIQIHKTHIETSKTVLVSQYNSTHNNVIENEKRIIYEAENRDENVEASESKQDNMETPNVNFPKKSESEENLNNSDDTVTNLEIREEDENQNSTWYNNTENMEKEKQQNNLEEINGRSTDDTEPELPTSRLAQSGSFSFQELESNDKLVTNTDSVISITKTDDTEGLKDRVDDTTKHLPLLTDKETNKETNVNIQIHETNNDTSKILHGSIDTATHNKEIENEKIIEQEDVVRRFYEDENSYKIILGASESKQDKLETPFVNFLNQSESLNELNISDYTVTNLMVTEETDNQDLILDINNKENMENDHELKNGKSNDEKLESKEKLVANNGNVLNKTHTDDTEGLENNVDDITKHLPLFENAPLTDKESTKDDTVPNSVFREETENQDSTLDINTENIENEKQQDNHEEIDRKSNERPELPISRLANSGSFSFQMAENLESKEKLVANNEFKINKTDDTLGVENNDDNNTQHLPLFSKHTRLLRDKEITKLNHESVNDQIYKTLNDTSNVNLFHQKLKNETENEKINKQEVNSINNKPHIQIDTAGNNKGLETLNISDANHAVQKDRTNKQEATSDINNKEELELEIQQNKEEEINGQSDHELKNGKSNDEKLESKEKLVANNGNVLSKTHTDDTEAVENNVDDITKHLPLFEKQNAPLTDKESTKGNEENNETKTNNVSQYNLNISDYTVPNLMFREETENQDSTLDIHNENIENEKQQDNHEEINRKSNENPEPELPISRLANSGTLSFQMGENLESKEKLVANNEFMINKTEDTLGVEKHLPLLAKQNSLLRDKENTKLNHESGVNAQIYETPNNTSNVNLFNQKLQNETENEKIIKQEVKSINNKPNIKIDTTAGNNKGLESLNISNANYAAQKDTTDKQEATTDINNKEEHELKQKNEEEINGQSVLYSEPELQFGWTYWRPSDEKLVIPGTGILKWSYEYDYDEDNSDQSKHAHSEISDPQLNAADSFTLGLDVLVCVWFVGNIVQYALKQ